MRESQLQSYDRNFSLMGLTAACVETVERRNNNNKSIKQLLLLLLLLLVVVLLAVRCLHSIVSALSRSSTIERKNEFE